MADFADRDFDGICYVEGSEGERMVEKNAHKVFVPAGLAAPTWNDDGKEDHDDVAITPEQRIAIINTNLRIVRLECADFREAFWVAYLRYLCIKNGWISLHFPAVVHHCSFQEATNDANLYCVRTQEEIDEEFKEIPTDEDLESFRHKVYDYVALLAYVFRARGHHYLDDGDFEESLKRVWKHMLYKETEIPIRFKIGFTFGLHAIYPDLLDLFWMRAAANARLAGAIIKRLDVAAAGSAVVAALYRGISDVRVTIPKLPADLEEQWDDFLVLHTNWKTHRWDYSVNARLYGVVRIRIREDEFSVLASYVVAVYKAIDDQAALVGSKALERNARANPVTGYIMQRATMQMVEKFSMALAYGPQLKEMRTLLEAEQEVD
jgi:hypothetical protein